MTNTFELFKSDTKSGGTYSFKNGIQEKSSPDKKMVLLKNVYMKNIYLIFGLKVGQNYSSCRFFVTLKEQKF